MIRELIVPFALVGVLASMLLPIPPGALDFLLVGNLVLALTLFVSSIYITDSLKLSSLPSLLLLATIYRLALNVATTRSILSTGEAGEVVAGFGHVVINGNLIVGFVIFLVITLIQFIVIAKGAERVAEVAARFTLDALPGKQMSIDADVRAGLIDIETAGKRRSDMQMESRFYGALDGAMKFVKGDAIAGLVMTAINIIGGLAVGLLMENLAIDRAAQKYTLLTIGDGLLSQIPALLNALAAGMVVTRVSRGDGSNLAQELLSQLGQVRKAKVTIGILSILMAFVPGMPALPFITLGALFLISGARNPKTNNTVAPAPEVKFEPRTPPVLQVELGPDLAKELQGCKDLLTKVQQFRKDVHLSCGLVLGVPEFSIGHELGAQFRIKMRGVSVCTGNCDKKSSELIEALLEQLKVLVVQRSEEFIDDILTRRTLDFFDKESPELVSAVVPNVATVTQLTEILKGLAREAINIRNFDIILQAVAEHGPKARGERALLEEVRVSLRRVISERYAPTKTLKAVVPSAVIDLSFVRSERENEAINLHALELLETTLRPYENDKQVVVLVSKAARRLLSECLKMRGIRLPVVAHEEIVDEVNIEVVARVDLEDETQSSAALDKLAA